MRTDEVRWRIAQPEQIRVVHLADAAVVFNPLSWQTHCLNAAACRIFDALAARPMSVRELLAETVQGAETLEPDEADELAAAFDRHVGDLALMGLIVRHAEAAA
jgi:PqqD family protein of HPr-rel-A system